MATLDCSKALKEYREKVFISQKELADLLGVSFVSVNRWENSHHKPTIKVKRKLHKLFVEAGIVEE